MNKTMLFGVSAIAGVVIVATVAQFAVGSSKPTTTEYIPCPFQPIAADTPRILSVHEAPESKDKAAYDEYWAERKKIAEYMKTEGSEREATPEERQALDAMNADKYVRALELSGTILQSNRQSIIGMYVRARALADGEASPARALNILRKARHSVESLGKANPADAIAREWYLRILYTERYVLESLGRDVEALRCVEAIEQVYSPMPWMKVWPLMRMKLYDEAETAIIATEKTGVWPTTVLNDRGALAAIQNDRLESYRCFQELCSLHPTNYVYHRNLGGACYQTFRIAQAEEEFLKATKLSRRYSRSSAFTDLANLFVQEGRFSEAVDALKNAQKQRSQRDPSTWQFDQGDYDLALTSLLGATGKLEAAERLARRSYDRPNRLGGSTQSEKCQEFSICLTLLSVLETRIAEMNELGAASLNNLSTETKRRSMQAECWVLQQKLIKYLDQKQLLLAFTPYSDCSGSPYSMSELARFLPYGVVSSVVQSNRATDNLAGTEAYYDAFMADAEFRNGRSSEALRLAKAALETLSVDGEKLLRSRLQMIAAMVCFQNNQIEEGVKFLDPALAAYPAVLRMLDAYIPVHIENDGSPTARQFAHLLNKSPRLRPAANGLRIHITNREGKLTVEMSRAADARHISVEVSSEDVHVEEACAALYRQFHEQLMSPVVALDQMTINGLDGSPLVQTRDRELVSTLLEATPGK